MLLYETWNDMPSVIQVLSSQENLWFKESLYSLAGVQYGIAFVSDSSYLIEIEQKPRIQAWKSNNLLYKYSQLPHASDTGRNISYTYSMDWAVGYMHVF